MKILAVQETDWIKRGPHQQHHLFEQLSLKGHEIRVIDHDYLWRLDKGPKYRKGRRMRNVSKYYKGSSIDVIRPPIIRLPIIDMVSIVLFHPEVISKEIRSFKPDVVVGFGILNTNFTLNIAKRNGVPFVYYLIDSLHTLLENSAMEFFAKRIEKSTLRNSEHILTINRALRSYCIEMGAEPGCIKVIPAGTDLEKFGDVGDQVSLKKKLGIGGDDVVLFFMGWLYEFSGILEVARSIVEGEGFKLLVVGEGDIYADLNELSQSNGDIILTGRVSYDEIPGLLACSDICLLPAHRNRIMENIVPIKIYEYLASGKPVIATELNGLVEEFGYGSGIMYVERPEQVVDMVKRLMYEGSSERLKAEALAYVQNKDWKQIVHTFEKYLMNIKGLNDSSMEDVHDFQAKKRPHTPHID